MPRGGRCCLRSQVWGYQKIPPREWKPHCDPVTAQRRPRVGLGRPRISRLTAEPESVVFERDPPAAPHTQEQPGRVWGLQTLPYCHHHPIMMPAVTWEHPPPPFDGTSALCLSSFPVFSVPLLQRKMGNIGAHGLQNSPVSPQRRERRV